MVDVRTAVGRPEALSTPEPATETPPRNGSLGGDLEPAGVARAAAPLNIQGGAEDLLEHY